MFAPANAYDQQSASVAPFVADTKPRYAAGVANKSMWGTGPRLFEVAWSSNVTLAHVS